MVRYQITLSFFLASCNKLLTSAVDYDSCGKIEDIGTKSLERFKYSVDMNTKKADDDEGNKVCSYQLDLAFKHDESLPLPDNPAVQCTPGPDAPFASDGLTYYDFRWYYEQIPEYITKATGIDHISIDFNPCGHPPFGVFTLPHYDIHFYTVDPKVRSCMICDKKFPTPACDPENQSSANGKAFFEAQTLSQTENLSSKSLTLPKSETINATSSYVLANMPSGYELGLNDMIPYMGGHAWDATKQPNEDNPWTEPFYLMGSFDSKIAFYESMVPYTFVSGNEDSAFEEEIKYIGQTIKNLPTTHSVSYTSDSKMITVSLEGVTDCDIGNEGEGIKEDKDSKEDEDANGKETEGEHSNVDYNTDATEEDTSGQPAITLSASWLLFFILFYFAL